MCGPSATTATSTDIFAIQDEISKAIVERAQLRLLPKEKKAIEHRGTENAEAYNLYLMARQQWVSGNDGDPRRDEVVDADLAPGDDSSILTMRAPGR